MDDLLIARSTMAFSLGFHIIFAAIGMTMPFFMATAHFLFLRTQNKKYLVLTKMWLKGVAILFAVGAVSGTVLAFELGLLWPGFMKYAGPIIGMPFSWEGTAFFLEAIAIGIFLYGWDRMPPWLHWFFGLLVGIAGFCSGIFVVSANGWMNTPTGFDWVNGQAINIDPVAAMFNNKAWFHLSLHMQLAAFEAVGFAVAGVHAYLLLKGKNKPLNLAAMKIALVFAAVAAVAQIWSGHISGERVAELQPLKLAAMEAHFETQTHAPIIIGGIPDVKEEKVHGAIKIPGLLSFLATESFSGEVKGLKDFPKEDWPPVLITHFAFQIMVMLGSLLAFIGVLSLFKMKKKTLESKWFLKTLVCMAPLGFIALESGWVVTEVGRQPWIIYGVVRTKDALTPMPGLAIHFCLFFILYIILAFATVWLMKRQIQIAQKIED